MISSAAGSTAKISTSAIFLRFSSSIHGWGVVMEMEHTVYGAKLVGEYSYARNVARHLQTCGVLSSSTHTTNSSAIALSPQTILGNSAACSTHSSGLRDKVGMNLSRSVTTRNTQRILPRASGKLARILASAICAIVFFERNNNAGREVFTSSM